MVKNDFTINIISLHLLLESGTRAALASCMGDHWAAEEQEICQRAEQQNGYGDKARDGWNRIRRRRTGEWLCWTTMTESARRHLADERAEKGRCC